MFSIFFLLQPPEKVVVATWVLGLSTYVAFCLFFYGAPCIDKK
jgi:hypothetical protein